MDWRSMSHVTLTSLHSLTDVRPEALLQPTPKTDPADPTPLLPNTMSRYQAPYPSREFPIPGAAPKVAGKATAAVADKSETGPGKGKGKGRGMGAPTTRSFEPRFVPPMKILKRETNPINNQLAAGNKAATSNSNMLLSNIKALTSNNTKGAKTFHPVKKPGSLPRKVTLMTLPQELRDRIFSYALRATIVLRVPPYFPTTEAHPPLLLVSREVHRQAKPLFFSANDFIVIFGKSDSQAIFNGWMKHLGKHVIRLRKILFVKADTAVVIHVTLEDRKAGKMEFHYNMPAAEELMASTREALEKMLPKSGGFTSRGLKAFFHTLSYKKQEAGAEDKSMG